MSKAELQRRIAEAARNTNHFEQSRLKTEAIVQYLVELKGK